MKKEYKTPFISEETLNSEDIIMRSFGDNDPLEVIVDWNDVFNLGE